MSDADVEAHIAGASYARLQELRAAIDARVEQIREEHVQRAADLGLTLVAEMPRTRRKPRRNATPDPNN